MAFSSLYVSGADDAGERRVFVLALSGELGSDAAGDLAAVLARALDELPGELFIDVRDLSGACARGIACLIGARQRAEGLGVHLAVIGGSSPAHRVLSLDDADSIDELIRCVAPGAPPITE